MVNVRALTWLVAGVLVLAPFGAHGREHTKTVRDAKYGVTVTVPFDWTVEVHSSFEVVSRGPQGGLETHAVVSTTPSRAVHDYFLVPGEEGPPVTNGPWTCAASRTWKQNPRVDVAVCARQIGHGHVLLVSLTGEKAWFVRVGRESFLRRLVAGMRGFRAEDD